LSAPADGGDSAAPVAIPKIVLDQCVASGLIDEDIATMFRADDVARQVAIAIRKLAQSNGELLSALSYYSRAYMYTSSRGNPSRAQIDAGRRARLAIVSLRRSDR
jgi:hypothetical protein